jgi:hypothetical protein
MRDVARRVARHVLPAHRRWQRTLDSLTLDPDALPRPVEPPGPRDVLICGSPRTGTALLTAMLFQPPRLITVMEPWDAMRLPPADLFRSVRAELATGRLARGRLDHRALADEGAVVWCADGASPVELTAAPDAVVAIKFPAFWRYLDLLPHTRFLVCVRDPADTVRSFEQTGGRLVQGLDYDIASNRSTNEQLLREHPTDAERRVGLYDLVNAKVLEHLHRPEVHAVRYERWFTDPDAQLAEIGEFLGVPVGPGPARLRPKASSSHPPPPPGSARLTSRTGPALGYPA